MEDIDRDLLEPVLESLVHNYHVVARHGNRDNKSENEDLYSTQFSQNALLSLQPLRDLKVLADSWLENGEDLPKEEIADIKQKISNSLEISKPHGFVPDFSEERSTEELARIRDMARLPVALQIGLDLIDNIEMVTSIEPDVHEKIKQAIQSPPNADGDKPVL